MCAAIVEPHDKMRSRDVNKVARGEQAPRPPQQTPNVSRPPPPSSTSRKVKDPGTAPPETQFLAGDQARHCYVRYLEHHKCLQERGKDAIECEKYAHYYRKSCPSEWVN
ncbi:hypothetical protein LguiA_034048 [Lonicera macranthoides]